MKSITQKPKKANPTLADVTLKAIEHWYKYRLLSKKEYKIQKEVWEKCTTQK